MKKDPRKNKFYFIQLNLQLEKHKELIEWILNEAGKKEQSLSSFIISLAKEKYEYQKNGTGNTK